MNSSGVSAQKVANAMGSKFAFGAALLGVAIWAALGPYYHYAETWQLVINTGTTIITFLAVFLIQYTQNRDTRAVQLKLDELLRAIHDARNSLIDIEDQSDEALEQEKRESAELVKSQNVDHAPQHRGNNAA